MFETPSEFAQMEGEAVSESTPMKEDFLWTASSLL